MSYRSIGSPTKLRVSPGLSRSQSYNLDVEHEATDEMIAERDAKIRELEETVKMLKEKLSICDTETTQEIEEDDNEVPVNKENNMSSIEECE